MFDLISKKTVYAFKVWMNQKLEIVALAFSKSPPTHTSQRVLCLLGGFKLNKYIYIGWRMDFLSPMPRGTLKVRKETWKLLQFWGTFLLPVSGKYLELCLRQIQDQESHPSQSYDLDKKLWWIGKIPILPCDKDESGRCLPDQSGTSYFHYCPRLVWEVLARLVWDLMILVLSQTRYSFFFITYLIDLGPHIFTIAPD